MIKFSNMTLEEFINLNRDEIPEEVEVYLRELENKYDALEEDYQIMKDRYIDLEDILADIKSTVDKY